MRRIEPLARNHERERFDCGSEALNLFLRQTARQHAARGISRTFVLVEESAPDPKPILGFFSLNICQVKSESLIAEEAKRLPRDVSGVGLGRLAVASGYQRQGIGKALLVSAMRKFIEIYKTAGAIGVFVDAKDQQAKNYDQQFGFVPMPSNELQLFLPVKTIEEALESQG